MKKVIVVIPIYREHLTLSERVSLAQVRRVLSHYDLCFMAPERMRRVLETRGVRAEYWPDACFAGRLGYSKLLLSPEFYARFSGYEYLLVYQLDAFVFHDSLLEFCERGYDYWGAPMPYSYWPVPAHIGNGGFSLRRVQACLAMLRRKAEIYAETGLQKEFDASEDFFLGYCGKRKEIPFQVPSVREALDFAVEFDVAHVWKRIVRWKLPFGCHAWPRGQYFNLWRPHIEPFVGAEVMDEIEQQISIGRGKSYRELEWGRISRILFQRMQERPTERNRKILRTLLPEGKQIFLWGNGKVGQRAKRLLTAYGIRIRGIFDAKAETRQMTEDGIPLLQPEEKMLRRNEGFILITTSKYEDEIGARLEQLAFRQRTDFLGYDEFERRFLWSVYGMIWYGIR